MNAVHNQNGQFRCQTLAQTFGQIKVYTNVAVAPTLPNRGRPTRGRPGIEDARGRTHAGRDRARRARATSPEIWDFIEGGSGAERTMAANRQMFARYALRPRTMVDVSACSPGRTLLGAPLGLPVGIAPMAYHRLVDPEGETATARAAGRAGALLVAGMFASRTLEEIAAAATGPLWLQLYWLRERAALAALVERAEAAGYSALVLTVDAPGSAAACATCATASRSRPPSGRSTWTRP